MRATSDSLGLIVVGETNDPKLPEQALDGLVMRLDLDGNLLWSKNFGGKTNEAFFGMDVAANGAIVAVGVTNKAFANSAGDGWLVRMDAKGAKISEETAATADHEEFRAVACTSDGACTGVGHVDVNHDGDGKFSKTYDKGHAWAVRWDAPGKIAWNRRFDALGQETLVGAIAAPDGSVIAVGDTRDPLLPDKPDGLVLRIDAQGNDLCDCQMFKTIAVTPTSSNLFGAVRAADDSVIAVGWQNWLTDRRTR